MKKIWLDLGWTLILGTLFCLGEVKSATILLILSTFWVFVVSETIVYERFLISALFIYVMTLMFHLPYEKGISFCYALWDFFFSVKIALFQEVVLTNLRAEQKRFCKGILFTSFAVIAMVSFMNLKVLSNIIFLGGIVVIFFSLFTSLRHRNI